jgi:hypothetical protein
MRWRRQRWQEGAGRPARPKVRSLSVDERVNYLNAMIRAIERSPVLTALSFDVRIPTVIAPRRFGSKGHIHPVSFPFTGSRRTLLISDPARPAAPVERSVRQRMLAAP